MIVEISAAEARVLQADDCTRLHVTTSLPPDDVGEALRTTGMGHLEGMSDAFLDLDALRTRASAAAREPGWDERWSKMIDYAASRGWLTADRAAVQAHVEHT